MKKIITLQLFILLILVGESFAQHWGGSALEIQRNAIRRHNVDQIKEDNTENRSAGYKIAPPKRIDPRTAQEMPTLEESMSNVPENSAYVTPNATKSNGSTKRSLSFSALSNRIKKNKAIVPTSSKTFKVKRLRRNFKGLAERVKKKSSTENIKSR